MSSAFSSKEILANIPNQSTITSIMRTHVCGFENRFCVHENYLQESGKTIHKSLNYFNYEKTYGNNQ